MGVGDGVKFYLLESNAMISALVFTIPLLSPDFKQIYLQFSQCFIESINYISLSSSSKISKQLLYKLSTILEVISKYFSLKNVLVGIGCITHFVFRINTLSPSSLEKLGKFVYVLLTSLHNQFFNSLFVEVKLKVG